MIEIIKNTIGYASLTFSMIGFVEIAIGFAINKTYNLLRAIVYSLLFGVGLTLLR